ncbi:MAG: 2-phospho-L-lactate guanylyltransferase [Betaproteobacteria bacterium]|nr:2-phospho-L-lactate guanylyltransferase [Betaproteobacteria bacterium]
MPLRRFWIIIPCQGLDRGKTRLGSVLGPAERRQFARQSLRHVVRAARKIAGDRHTLVVSRSGEVLGLARRLGVSARAERESGLNAAVRDAVSFARRRGAAGIAVLHADLPQLSSRDVVCLLHALARQSGVVLAPDRDCEGTNALALRPAGRFEFHFGTGSFKKHSSSARRMHIRTRVLKRPGLAADVDTPEHYEALECFLAAGRPSPP